ncbi:cell division peptidoglycan polymerase FtsW [Streptococcus ovuberis]|uniref:Probable peptidoglycan glycosyltransferase FtsW n=1 Tax=Streptococcus ovuberis TaxID=1936207 RepID=A0A7X6MZG3_9STRE|nr:FtsW/RodA/SpoVE family cell cycle protein [Streptococcus ovuberis]NKZ21240.1 FtsW/RodA/SpoVE family cell cycle protein [Streptococcus ovuberis]
MKINKGRLMNYSILLPYLILSVLGLIIVYSTTSANSILTGGNPFKSVISQSAFFLVSLILLMLIYRMKLTFLGNGFLITIVLWVEAGLLIASRIFGQEVNGARGWLNFGSYISIQPAEYLKLIIVWYLAYKFSKIQDLVGTYDYQVITENTILPRSFTDWRTISGLLIGLVVIMPDLGNAVIITLTVAIMVAVSGIGFRWFQVIFGSIFLSAGAFLGLIWLVGVDTMAKVPIFGYVARRFSAFFDPFIDPRGAGLQMTNSYYAMTNGGWFGLGLGNSIEKNGYLPEAHTDFVFSIVLEELGLVGASLILALLFFLILRIFLVGIRAKNPFNAMMAMGVGGMLLMQTFVNIGGMSGLIPSTGVTFPFLSQGGNSLLIISLAIAFVLNIDASEKRDALERQMEVTQF